MRRVFETLEIPTKYHDILQSISSLKRPLLSGKPWVTITIVGI